jgi:hypothetical protein
MPWLVTLPDTRESLKELARLATGDASESASSPKSQGSPLDLSVSGPPGGAIQNFSQGQLRSVAQKSVLPDAVIAVDHELRNERQAKLLGRIIEARTLSKIVSDRDASKVAAKIVDKVSRQLVR